MATPPLPFSLTEEERASAIWRKLAGHLDSQLRIYREQNEALVMMPEARGAVIGQIREVKRLLALGDPPKLMS